MSGGARWAATIGAAALTLLVAATPALARLRWAGCGDVEAECAHVRVPLDRSGAVRGSVRLRVARFGDPSRRPTLLYLSGGPGGAGVREFADVLFEVGAPRARLRAHLLRPARDRLLRAAALPARSSATRACAPRAPARSCATRLGARRALLRHARVGRGHRGAAGGARRAEADAVRDLLRHEARARLRARPSRPRRADGARLRARPRRRRRLRPRALPRDGAVAGGAVPRGLPGRERRPGRRPRAARRPAARGAAARRRLRHARPQAAREADRARALGPDVRRRLQPRDPRGDPGRRAGGARQRRPGAAAAARRRRREPVLAADPAGLLGRALRRGVRGDAAAVAARGAVRRARRSGRRRRPTGSGAARSSRSPTRRRARTRSTSACAGPRPRRRRPRAAATRRSRR